MKKILCIATFLLAGFGLFRVYSQPIPSYPIPSFGVSVDGYANFREGYSNLNPNQINERRDVDVEVKSGSGTHGCEATVWVYTLDRSTVLGPYTVTSDDILTVEVDENEWGVLVLSDEEEVVSVWFGQSELLLPKKIKSEK